MSFNFPNSPSSGQTYTPAGGPVFTWDGIAWRSYVQDVPITVYVSDEAPVGPTIGQLWWESDTGNMFIWYNDPDGSQWVQVSGSVSATPTAETRNRIVNPAMQISQENGDAGGGLQGYHVADQWYVSTAGTYTGQSNRGNGPTPYGSPKMATTKVTVAKPSPVVADYYALAQSIEGIRIADFQWGTAAAKQVVVRFCVYSNVAGTFNVMLTNAAYSHYFVKSFTISAGEVSTYKYVTVVVPGPTVGTWLSTNVFAMELVFPLSVGSNYANAVEGSWQAGNKYQIAGSLNFAASTSNQIWIGDVGLYLDPLNTGVPPRWQMPDEAEELRACQRYFYVDGAQFTAGMRYGAAASGNADAGTLNFPTTMRTTTPAITGVGPVAINCSAAAYTGNANGVIQRVTVTALGNYRNTLTSLLANARM